MCEALRRGVRRDRPAVGAQARADRRVALQRGDEILVDLDGALAHVVMGNGHHAVTRGAGLGDAAGQQAIAQAELPAQNIRWVLLGVERLFMTDYISRSHARFRRDVPRRLR